MAEISSPLTRGIIISFPSTMAVSFVFLAITLGSDKLLPNLPGVYYSLLGSVLYVLSFSMFAQKFASNSVLSIALTVVVSSLAWLIVPMLSRELPREISIALPTFLIAIALLQPLFYRYADKFPLCSQRPMTGLREFLFRVIFSGTIISAAIIFAKLIGPFWGAVIGGTYPVALGSQMMIFRRKYPPQYLPSVIRTVPVGVTSTAAYATVVSFAYPKIGIIAGTLLAFVVSFCVSKLVMKFFGRKK